MPPGALVGVTGNGRVAGGAEQVPITFAYLLAWPHRLRESATFDRLTDARAWAAKTEAAMKAGRHFGESRKHTLGELVDEYGRRASADLKDWPKRQAHLARWLAELGDCALSDITPRRIAAIRDKLTGEPLPSPARDAAKAGPPRYRSETTTNRYMASLSACLAFGVKELGWLERNPCERVSKGKENPGRVRFLSDDERARLLAACRESSNKDLYLAVVLSLTTGARQSEILGLRYGQIDFGRRLVTLNQGTTKNADARSLPLVGEALALLQERAKFRALRDDRVFPPAPGAKSRFTDPRASWEAALKRAGIKDFKWHDLRHTAASYLMMAGVSPLEISRILGHRTMAMVARYSHLAPGRTVEIGEGLAVRLGLG